MLGYYATKDVNSSIVTDAPVSQQSDLTPATDVTEPADVQDQADTSDETAPSEVSQQTGDASTEQGEAQMSSDPDNSTNQESAPDNAQETQ